jgi:hypothetical protein
LIEQPAVTAEAQTMRDQCADASTKPKTWGSEC